jgi:hypothetical protein
MLNMVMRKNMQKQRVVRLNEPTLKDQPEGYSDLAK